MNSTLRRSLISVPGSSEKMVLNSLSFQADQIFFDWEDAVAPSRKSMARNLVSDLLNRDLGFSAPFVSIRINSTETRWFQDDMEAIKNLKVKRLFSLIVPKVLNSQTISKVSERLADIESTVGLAEGSILIDAQIESAIGLVNAEEIARHARVASLSFGPLDFLADIGTPWSSTSSSNQNGEALLLIQYALIKILIAARAARKMAFDGPVVEIRDIKKFEASANNSRALGFDGKWVLHPEQIDPCNRIFTPSEEEYESALRTLRTYEASISDGGDAAGAILFDEVMVDEASRQIALKTIHRMEAFRQ